MASGVWWPLTCESVTSYGVTWAGRVGVSYPLFMMWGMDASSVLDELVVGVGMSTEVLATAICRGAANMTAAEGEWLGLVAEFDRRRGWEPSGCRSCAAWLMWQTGLDRRTAHEKVRVAHALVAFPRLAMAMSRGWLPYAKVRAISRIANDDNVAELVSVAQSTTTSEVERIVAAYRRREPLAADAEQRAHADRGLSMRDEGATTVITIRVPTETGAVVLACIDRFVTNTRDPDGALVAIRARRADAVVAMAEHAAACIDQTGDYDVRYQATVHLTPDIFDNDDVDAAGSEGCGMCCVAPGEGLSHDPVAVPVATARRMLCDAVLVGYRSGDVHGDDIERIGDSQRVVSRRMKKALRLRDGCCRFPGCTRAGWVDAHHIRHWINGGPTVETNLVCLCRAHHRLVHESGWRITGNPNEQIVFHRPDGSTFVSDPTAHIGNPEAIDERCRQPAPAASRDEHDRISVDDLVRCITDHETLNRTHRHN